MATNRRPMGVKILATLQLISGVGNILVSSVGLLLGGLATLGGVAMGDANASQTGEKLLIITIITLILGIFALIVSFGLFSLKGWAWNLTIFVQAASLINKVIGVISGTNVGVAIFSIIISATILYYLSRQNVKEAFGKT